MDHGGVPSRTCSSGHLLTPSGELLARWKGHAYIRTGLCKAHAVGDLLAAQEPSGPIPKSAIDTSHLQDRVNKADR